jgi:hypothetical protein
MGLFDGLFGKKQDAEQSGRFKIPTSRHNQGRRNPEYDSINDWIEARIGTIDPADPTLQTRLDSLVRTEKAKYPSVRGKLQLTQRGNDTIVTGDTSLFKNRLKRLGCKWDSSSKCWVAKNKQLTEKELDCPGQVVGLEAYIKTNLYRKNLDNP